MATDLEATSAADRPQLSIVIPMFNEAGAICDTLARIVAQLDALTPAVSYEVLVIDDGSNDGSGAKVAGFAHAQVRLVAHPYNIGNGAAVKTGIRHARGDYILLLDADGQHQPADIPRFLELRDCFHMIVGARSSGSQASLHRGLANRVYNSLASYVCGRQIDDLTSGFRLVQAEVAHEFLYLLPNTFSYPTTLTMALMRAGYTVTYIPIETQRRVGRSKIRLLRDGSRFMMIILRIAIFFSPMKVFGPVSGAMFGVALAWYIYKRFYLHTGFPPVSSLLMISALIIFCIGLVSEQVAALRSERQ